MRYVWIVPGFAIAACGIRRPPSHAPLQDLPAALAARGAILSPTVAHISHFACSRQVPEGVTDYWVPSVEVVQALEDRLPALLDSALAEIPAASVAERPRYYRQYVGIRIGSRDLVLRR